ncbi:hypothetical protein CPB86DRAFT_778970 [Serendipita vermifera]|nr:hypothetical protein CPB86DRAFT_778970 [Serendipita vermifera]
MEYWNKSPEGLPQDDSTFVVLLTSELQVLQGAIDTAATIIVCSATNILPPLANIVLLE